MTDNLSPQLITGPRRFRFMHDYLRGMALRGEGTIYAFADRLSVDYTGGSWEFYSDGNVYFMVPAAGSGDAEHGDMYRVTWGGNGFVGNMHRHAFGIVANLFGLCKMIEDASARQEETRSEFLAERYYALMEYAAGCEECDLIFSAID